MEEKATRDSYLVFGRPAIEQAEIDELVASMNSRWLGTGPKVAQFEEKFRKYVGCENALAVNSCTAALHLALLVSGVGRGDEVITTPMTFCATANVIVNVGATPIFVDIRRDTMNIDPDKIEAKITSKTKAIIPVHFAGRPCEMHKIMEIARKNNLVVIEDAAHAIETVYKGEKVGAIGDITCFSFYVTKNITTGEGGMVCLSDSKRADKIKMLALHGMDKDAWKRYSDDGYKHYSVVYPGFKYNMMDLQAAIGLHQIERIEQYWRRRQQIWEMYNVALADLPITLPKDPEPNTKHAYHLYTVLIDEERAGISRDEVQAALHKDNIGTGIHFIALHLHKYYKETFGFNRGDFPEAEHVSDRTLSLPFSASMSNQDVNDVVSTLRKIIKNAKS